MNRAAGANGSGAIAGRRIGVLGGTFDPPHIGHLVPALEVVDALELDELVLMVAADPWQKRGQVVATADDRLAMVAAAVESAPRLRAGSEELDRGGVTYTVDTLLQLRAAEPESSLFLVLGADAAAGLSGWHRWEELPELATIVVMDRPGAPHECPVPCRRVEVTQLDVSSSALRARAGSGRSWTYLVPDSVIAVARERGLYGGQND